MFGFDFYTKLVVPFDMGATFGGASASNPFGMLPMLMMMSDKNKSSSNDNSMLMAMLMSQMMQGAPTKHTCNCDL